MPVAFCLASGIEVIHTVRSKHLALPYTAPSRGIYKNARKGRLHGKAYFIKTRTGFVIQILREGLFAPEPPSTDRHF